MKSKQKKIFFSYISIIFMAVFIASIIRFFIFESYRIPTELMEPNLIPGDLIFVNKSAYDIRIPYFKKNKSLPQYTDIIIYTSKSEPGLLFIKRVVGLPGDSLQIENGQIRLNNKALDFTPSENKICGAENHPHSPYQICLEPPLLNLIEKRFLQKDEIFVIGDKRGTKNDRPIWDVIHPNQIIGKAQVIWLSIDPESKNSQFFPLIRFNRIFKKSLINLPLLDRCFLDKSGECMAKNIIAASDLNLNEIQVILTAAHHLSQIEAESIYSEKLNVPLLKNKIFVQLFFENSTRTKTSFELAIRRLGGSTLSFSPSSSSTQKGESLIDTAKNIQAMKPDGLIVRHTSAGSPYILSQHLNIPIINAGDGFHEHPTQGLLDVFTMTQKLGDLKNKNIVIIGDIAHSRVARSNIHLLKKLGAKITVCGPPTLMPPSPEKLGVHFTYNLDEVIESADVVMTLRIQFERHQKFQIPSIKEYSTFWGLNIKRAERMKPQAIIMHPGPMNQGVEIDPEVVESGRSVILNQVYNGILVRMATLGFVFYGDSLLEKIKSSHIIKELP